MFKAFAQFFATLFTLFSAAERGASALNHLASIGDEMAEGFALEERLKRQARVKKLQQELEQIGSTSTAATAPAALPALTS